MLGLAVPRPGQSGAGGGPQQCNALPVLAPALLPSLLPCKGIGVLGFVFWGGELFTRATESGV